MASEHYWEGRNLESKQLLHEELQRCLQLDEVQVDGATDTKGDIIGTQSGERVPISVKNASGNNTQVHITTLKQLSLALDMPADVMAILIPWLGDNNTELFETWRAGRSLSAYELSHNRIKSFNLNNWSTVETWVNLKNQDFSLPKVLIQSLNKEAPAKWLVWVRKKKGGFQVVDVNKLVTWIGTECTWASTPGGTVLRCTTPEGKPILTWQMKGNREEGGRYNHTPQFHLHNNWPKEFVVYEDTSIRF